MREEGFVSVHGLQGYRPLQHGRCGDENRRALTTVSVRKRELGRAITQAPTSAGLFPQAALDLLKFPQCLKTAPPSAMFKHDSVRGISHPNQNRIIHFQSKPALF